MEKDLNFDLGFTPEQFSGLQGEDGAGWRLTAFGDYRFKIVDGEIIASKNAKKPHNMVKIIFEVSKAHDEKNAGEIGSQCNGLYGTASSPDYMQKRFKQLCDACKVVPGKNGMKFSQLLGKEFDGTVVWELSDSGKLDEMGNKKFFVNARVKAERVIGSPRPKTLNPIADSQKAVKYLAGQDVEAPADAAPWAPQAAGNDAGGSVEHAPSFVPESEVDPVAHEYRALYKLGGDESEPAKQALIEAGTDPDGPIDLANVSAETRAKYEQKFGGGASDGRPKLKPLAKPGAGTRQVRA